MPRRATTGNMFSSRVDSVFTATQSDINFKSLDDIVRIVQEKQSQIERMQEAIEKDIQETIRKQEQMEEKLRQLEQKELEKEVKGIEKQEAKAAFEEEKYAKVDRVTRMEEEIRGLIEAVDELMKDKTARDTEAGQKMASQLMQEVGVVL